MVADEDVVGCLAGHLRAAARAATRRDDARLAGAGLRIGSLTPRGERRLAAAAPQWRAAQELMLDRLGSAPWPSWSASPSSW